MAQNALFLLKKMGIKILAGFLNGLIHLKNLTVFILTWTVAKPLWWLGKTVLFSFAVKIYKIALVVKIRWWDKFYAPIKTKFIYPLTRRYVIHSVIILIALLSVSSNISAKEASLENAEQIGQKSILYTLTYNNDSELNDFDLETADTGGVRTVSYLGQDVGLSLPAAAIGDENFSGDLPIPSIGEDSAFLNPILPSTINENSRTKIVEYQVEGGDAISTIAEKFSLNVTTILWANKLTSTSTIRPGDKLVILPTNGVLHQVKTGDTVDKIAKYYSADAEKVLEFNALPDASDIKIGETLIVPGGVAPKPIPAPTPRTTVASRNTVNIPSLSTVPTGGKMIWPNGCSRITQYYGWRHTGIDIACSAGTSILAADDGVVSRVQYIKTGYGHNVMIDHGGGVVTLYGHMTKILVEAGDTVKRGQEIGLEGSTGRSTGPHLHFEVRINGKIYNPLNYIK
jgi:murein DD-endopeptidase MepM/ murein hydrolase activator NlpD